MDMSIMPALLRIFTGRISKMTRKGSVSRPSEAMKSMNENAATGNQSNPLVSYPLDFRYVCAPIASWLTTTPTPEMSSSSLRPARSTNTVDTYVPTNCMRPTMIAEMVGERLEPADSNIMAV